MVVVGVVVVVDVAVAVVADGRDGWCCVCFFGRGYIILL